MQTIPVSAEYWVAFKSLVRSRGVDLQPAEQKPERWKLIRAAKPVLFAKLLRKKGKVVASFGAANPICHREGRGELLACSPRERAVATEWSSLLQHEAALSSAPLPAPGPSSQRPRTGFTTAY